MISSSSAFTGPKGVILAGNGRSSITETVDTRDLELMPQVCSTQQQTLRTETHEMLTHALFCHTFMPYNLFFI